MSLPCHTVPGNAKWSNIGRMGTESGPKVSQSGAFRGVSTFWPLIAVAVLVFRFQAFDR